MPDPTSLQAILHQLNDGKSLRLRFPSPKERESFRVALYKAKREVDEVFLMTDPEFEVGQMNFRKEEIISQEQGKQEHYASIWIQSKSAANPIRSYNFDIVEVSDHEPSNSSPASHPS